MIGVKPILVTEAPFVGFAGDIPLFTEHVHPNFNGYCLIAYTIAKNLSQHSLLSQNWDWKKDDFQNYKDKANVTSLSDLLVKNLGEDTSSSEVKLYEPTGSEL